jgi:hypothetical protein
MSEEHLKRVYVASKLTSFLSAEEKADLQALRATLGTQPSDERHEKRTHIAVESH